MPCQATWASLMAPATISLIAATTGACSPPSRRSSSRSTPATPWRSARAISSETLRPASSTRRAVSSVARRVAVADDSSAAAAARWASPTSPSLRASARSASWVTVPESVNTPAESAAVASTRAPTPMAVCTKGVKSVSLVASGPAGSPLRPEVHLEASAATSASRIRISLIQDLRQLGAELPERSGWVPGVGFPWSALAVACSYLLP